MIVGRNSLIHWTCFIEVVCLLSIFAACSNSEEVAEIIPDPDSELYFAKSIDFSSDSGEEVISFTTNKDWTISISESGGYIDWCSVFPTEGKAGENQVKVIVTENTDIVDRNVTLTLKAQNLTKQIVVTQKQKDAITLTASRFELDRNGGEIQVEVKANVDYNVIIPQQYQDWIHEKEVTFNQYTFEIDKSMEYDKREGEIIFQSGNLEEVLNIYQSGGGILLLTQNKYIVSSKGEDIAVELKSNCEFDIDMPSVDWITTTKTRNVSSHTLYYTIAPNETYEQRETEIIYSDKNNPSLKDTLTIIQAQKDVILLSGKKFEMPALGGFVEIYVESNVDYSFKIDEASSSWIKCIPNYRSRNVVREKSVFQVSENVTSERRIGNIFLVSSESSVTDTVQIIQAAKTIVEEKSVTVTVEKAGILRGMLGTDVNMITRLKVIGPINGTDLRTLREMAGVDFYGNTTSGQLRELDLTQATICSGGDDYMEHWDSDNIVNSIPVACFMYSNLVSVSLPINLKSIENQAFFWCEKLENVVIPSTCRRIGMNAFGVTSLASIDIPRGVGDIGIKAFDRCYNLKSINVHADNISYSSVNGILCDDAMETLLYYPSGKGEINIPDNVKYIDESAFDDCVRSKSLFIPANVVTIPSKACMYMSQLSSIEVDINNKYYTSIDGVLYSKNVTDLVACPKLKESLVIPESVQFISSYACWKCANLREVKMHDNISVIGENAFYECTNLADIVFSSNLINIDASAFFNCTRLTTISLPKSLSSLGNAAFCGCENLMVIYSWRDFPPLIGDNAFYRISPNCIVYVPQNCKESYLNNKEWGNLTILEME